MKEIIVTFDDGQTTIETRGFKGKACQIATAGLEADLGIKTDDVPTDEMRQVETEARQTRDAGR